jgi:DNA polymerase-3 subunit delta'
MWSTIGHEKAVNHLTRGLQMGRLSHAYLLTGPRQVGKMSLAIDLARALNCTGEDRPCGDCVQCDRISRGLHADIRVVGVETGAAREGGGRIAIGIDQVRETQREASLKPFEGSYRVFVFDGAEHLTAEAANSLLKTLEEPPDQVVIVLLATDSDTLPPTVVSRCRRLELRPVARSLIVDELASRFQTDADTADEIARLSQGRPGWAFEAANEPEKVDGLLEELDAIQTILDGSLEERFAYAQKTAGAFTRDRESGRRHLATWLALLRDVLLVKHGVPQFATHRSRLQKLTAVADSMATGEVSRALRAVRESADLMERNVNARLALEGMMLALPRR